MKLNDRNVLRERKIHLIKSNDDMLQILMKEEYGYMPTLPEDIGFRTMDNHIPNFCAGKAIFQPYRLAEANKFINKHMRRM